MADKIIYIVPKPGLKEGAFKVGYEDHSIDVPFRIESTLRLGNSKLTYQIPLGFKTYTDSGCGGMLLMPRSKASLLWEKEQLHTGEGKPQLRRSPVDYKQLTLEGRTDDAKAFMECDIRLANTIGYIDYSYRGEWIARLKANGAPTITPDKQLLQAVPLNTEYKFKVVSSLADVPKELIETERGDGAYGSTDQPTESDDSKQTSDS